MLDTVVSYIKLMRLDKPVGIYLLLWPTLWSLWLASEGQPQRTVLLVLVAGVVLTRSGGCILNDSADRHFDAQVERTRNRPLVTGEISLQAALILAGVLLLLAFALVLLLNFATILMSLVALLLAMSYPWMKRFTYLPQVYLGLTFGWAIPMAWVAQTNTFPSLAIWLLYAANICWTTGYDTIYALADREHDLRAGVKSTAILFGKYDRALIAVLQSATLIFLVLVGLVQELGWGFYLAVLAASGCFIYQQWKIKDETPVWYLRAFANNAWVGLIIFMGLFLDLLPTSN